MNKIAVLLIASMSLTLGQIPVVEASSSSATTNLSCQVILGQYLDAVKGFQGAAKQIKQTMENNKKAQAYQKSDINVVKAAHKDLSKTPTHNDLVAEYGAINYMYSQNLSANQQKPLSSLIAQLQTQFHNAGLAIDPWGASNSTTANNMSCKDLYQGCDLGEKGCDKRDSVPKS